MHMQLFISLHLANALKYAQHDRLRGILRLSETFNDVLKRALFGVQVVDRKT